MGKTEITENYRVRGSTRPKAWRRTRRTSYRSSPTTRRELLDELYARGVRHLMIEGGPGMVGLFAGEDLIDEMVWYRAPDHGAGQERQCTVCSWHPRAGTAPANWTIWACSRRCACSA